MIERSELMAKAAAWRQVRVELAERGSRTAGIVTLLPRLNLAPVRGERLVELVRLLFTPDPATALGVFPPRVVHVAH